MNDSYQHKKGCAWKWTTVINIKKDALENEQLLSTQKRKMNRGYCAKFETASLHYCVLTHLAFFLINPEMHLSPLTAPPYTPAHLAFFSINPKMHLSPLTTPPYTPAHLAFFSINPEMHLSPLTTPTLHPGTFGFLFNKSKNAFISLDGPTLHPGTMFHIWQRQCVTMVQTLHLLGWKVFQPKDF